MKKLTKRQSEILRYIKRYIKKYGLPPSGREVADNFDMHTNGAYTHINALLNKGALVKQEGKARSIRIASEF